MRRRQWAIQCGRIGSKLLACARGGGDEAVRIILPARTRRSSPMTDPFEPARDDDYDHSCMPAPMIGWCALTMDVESAELHSGRETYEPWREWQNVHLFSSYIAATDHARPGDVLVECEVWGHLQGDGPESYVAEGAKPRTIYAIAGDDMICAYEVAQAHGITFNGMIKRPPAGRIAIAEAAWEFDREFYRTCLCTRRRILPRVHPSFLIAIIVGTVVISYFLIVLMTMPRSPSPAVEPPPVHEHAAPTVAR